MNENKSTGYLHDFMPNQYQQRAMMQSIPQSKEEQDLMQKLLDIKRQVTIPLRYTLKGWTQNIKGDWVEPEGDYTPLMNKKGINWAVQFVESYCSVEFLISNYNDDWLKYVMRGVIKEIGRVLAVCNVEFGLQKQHIWQISRMIEHKILSLLLGALNDGFRRWIGENRSVQEIKQTLDHGQGGGFGLFKKKVTI